MFEQLASTKPDAIMAVMAQYKADPRDNKIDLGPGVYRDDAGNTPVMEAVKSAEQILHTTQDSKAYIGLVGDKLFLDHLRDLAFGDISSEHHRLTSIQTPGGCGALGLAAQLIRYTSQASKILFGLPTWANHGPLFQAAGIEIESHQFYDADLKKVDFESVVNALLAANAGDVALLHACCHNPTGSDFTLEQWQEITAICNKKGLIPLVDMAYQGFGDGIEEDRQGIRHILQNVEEAIVTVSCSKNFGLYRERTGAIFVLTKDQSTAKLVQDNLCSFARHSYSMPPDHGAAIVATILGDKKLKGIWLAELNVMRERIINTRQTLAAELGADFKFLQQQRGLFSLLPLSQAQIKELNSTHGIYMSPDGRINLAGFKHTDIKRFAKVINSL
ncbi:amino acid aminotransferase [Aliiglaciecola sp. SL4]|uniref:amino acid aminotransferase n=1 Tax=Aliiglaciecola sp. SL4 TaxID=3239806 RepID=UPI00355BFCD4